MKELFRSNSAQNGSMAERRLVFAEAAPRGLEQQAEQSKEKPKGPAQSPEQAAKETKAEGKKAIHKATIEMPELEIKPRTEQERAKDEQISAKIKGLFNNEAFAKIKETTPNDPMMRELETEIYTELPNKLAKRLIAQLERMDAIHLPSDQLQKVADQIYKIVDDFAVEQDEKRTSRSIAQLYRNPEIQAIVANAGILPLLRQKEGPVADLFGPSTEGATWPALASKKGRK